MNRTRRSTLILSAAIVLLLVFPSIGDTVRAAIAFLFGETGSGIVEVLAGVASIAALLYVILEPRLRRSNQGSPSTNTATPAPQTSGGQSRSPEGAGTKPTINAEDDARSRIRDEARRVARDLSEWQHDRDVNDPFSLADEIPRDMDSPEYKELEAKQNQHLDETERQYNNTLLPRVAQVRSDLASYNVKNPELDKLYGKPRKHENYRVVAERLYEMAAALDRQIPPELKG